MWHFKQVFSVGEISYLYVYVCVCVDHYMHKQLYYTLNEKLKKIKIGALNSQFKDGSMGFTHITQLCRVIMCHHNIQMP